MQDVLLCIRKFRPGHYHPLCFRIGHDNVKQHNNNVKVVHIRLFKSSYECRQACMMEVETYLKFDNQKIYFLHLIISFYTKTAFKIVNVNQ